MRGTDWNISGTYLSRELRSYDVSTERGKYITVRVFVRDLQQRKCTYK
jgi:hypothetical protein